MKEEVEVRLLLKSIDKAIDLESSHKELTIIVMNKKLFNSFDNYMSLELLNSTNDIYYDWYSDGTRYYRNLKIIRTKNIKGYLVA